MAGHAEDGWLETMSAQVVMLWLNTDLVTHVIPDC